jgi:hypothetical protein
MFLVFKHSRVSVSKNGFQWKKCIFYLFILLLKWFCFYLIIYLTNIFIYCHKWVCVTLCYFLSSSMSHFLKNVTKAPISITFFYKCCMWVLLKLKDAVVLLFFFYQWNDKFLKTHTHKVKESEFELRLWHQCVTH